MKITTFDPMIITKDTESVTALFEALGFERRHQPTGTSTSGYEYAVIRMTDANGFHVDVATSSGSFDRDITAIRINVDNFMEAYELLSQRGFKTANGKPATETDSSRGVFMISPSGFAIVLCQHIKD